MNRHLTAPRTAPWILLVWLLGLVLALGVLLMRGHVEADLARFMPDVAAESGLDLPAGAGPAGRLLLLGISGGGDATRAQASDALAERLQDLPAVTAVHNGRPRLDEASLDTLLDYRYLLSPAMEPGRLSGTALAEHLAVRRDDLAASVPALPRHLIPRDPSAESLALLDQLAAPRDAPRRDAHGVWVSRDGHQALLSLLTRAEGLDLDVQEALLAVIRAGFQDIAPGLVLEISGPAAVAVQARSTIRNEVMLFSTLASLTLAGLLWWLFRSLRPVWLAALPLGAGLLAGAALVTLVFGQIHGITLAFGITVLGVALDYPLHLFAHANRPASSPSGAADSLWPALALGAISTALVYALMALTAFTGMAQLGLFVLTGILVAALTTRFILPGLLGRTGLPEARLPAPAWLLDPPRAGRWLLGALVLGALVVLAITEPFPWEDDLSALNPVSEEQRRLDRHLRGELKLADVRHVLVLRADTVEQALARTEALTPALEDLRASGSVAGFDTAARILPSRATQETRRQSLPDADNLARDLRAAARDQGFREGAFQPFLDDLESARTQLPLTPQTLPPTLAEALAPLLMAQGETWLSLISLSGVTDPGALDGWVVRQDLPTLTHVDFKAHSEAVVTGFRDEALTRLAWGLLAVTVVLLVFTRSPGRSLRVLSAVGAGLILATAALLLLQVRLTLFHLVGLLLVTGLCLDYAVFFSRPLASLEDRRRNLGSVSACALSTALVFGLLALSALPVLRALGLTVLLGVIFSFLAAALLAQASPHSHPPQTSP
ncbi:MAG: MMPL family transporter [Thioalkalivibrio sp.]